MKVGPRCYSYAAPNLLAHLRKEIVKQNAGGRKCLLTAPHPRLLVVVCVRAMTIFIVIELHCWVSEIKIKVLVLYFYCGFELWIN